MNGGRCKMVDDVSGEKNVTEHLETSSSDALPPILLEDDVSSFLRESYVNEQSILVYGTLECECHFQNLLHCLGTPPLYTTLRINIHQQPTETIIQLLNDELEKNGDRLKVVPDIFVHPMLPDVVFIPVTGPNLSLTVHSKEVIVDVACGMAVLRGADIFVQGIMGVSAGLRRGDLVTVYVDVDGGCLHGLPRRFPGRKQFVGNGVARVSREELYCHAGKVKSGVGISMIQPLYNAPRLSGVLPGLVFPQNLPSIVCGYVLDPQPGECVLDMCAAPGGKTTHLAVLMKDEGRLIALDKTTHKVERIRWLAEKWQLTCIEAHVCDSTRVVQHLTGCTAAPPYPPGTFDRVLLDAPCSGLGQRPSCKNKISLTELRSYPRYQKKLFNQAVDVLKPGGTLVYSTCTLTLDENERLVEWALHTFSNLKLVSQNPYLGMAGLPGTSLSSEQVHLLQRFDPSFLTNCAEKNFNTDTIGFFIAKFKKGREELTQ